MTIIPKHLFPMLQENWGERAESMECDAICRIYDPAVPEREWYVYAQNPDDTNEIICIEHDDVLCPAARPPLDWLSEKTNCNYDSMKFDHDFKPKNVVKIWQKLRKKYPYNVIVTQ